MNVTCPLCGEFDGTVPEVQAHISGKSDKPHQGKAGDDVLKNPAKAMEVQGEKADRPGPETTGTALDVPKVACKKCGREVAYPELMPYKMTCPGCGKEMRKRKAAEEMEEKADEKGKNELVEPVEA